MITEKQNNAVVQRLVLDWRLGPTVTSVDKYANKTYWAGLAKAWDIPEDEARRRFCANCEYFDNTPEMLKEMEAIPINALDRDGGGRGWCHKFDFICHNLRACQAWERKEYYPVDPEDESNAD
jgi:hypothetical protein